MSNGSIVLVVFILHVNRNDRGLTSDSSVATDLQCKQLHVTVTTGYYIKHHVTVTTGYYTKHPVSHPSSEGTLTIAMAGTVCFDL